MDDKTIGALAIGSIVTGAIAYLFRLLGKRHDKLDKLDERVATLEKAQTEVVYLKAQVEDVRRDLKEALSILTELRIQLSSVPKRRGVKLLTEE